MASNYTRRISIYINGKEVKNDIASIKSEMNKLIGQQARMTIGSKEYVSATREIKKLKSILVEHRDELKVVSKSWSGMQKAIGMAVTAAAGITGIGVTISKFFNAYREQERAVQKVAQAIESTGNAAGLSLKTLTKEATNLQNKTLFGDEEILNKSTAQLLTFTNIAGTNFLKAQQAALDLATVLDGDLQNSTIMLGKALNDPIRGMTALRRVGVSFTEDQREQIKVLAETNRLEEAQNIILGEMTRQYGGQAEAAAKGTGVWKQVKMQLGEITEAIGGKMGNALIEVGTKLRDFFKSLAEQIVETSAVDIFDAQVTSVLNLTEKIDPLLDRYDELKSKSKLSKDEQSELKTIIDQVAESVPGAVSAFDEYGKAIGINTTKAREFINEQVAMMGVMNKSAIEEAAKKLAGIKTQVEQAKFELDKIMRTGTVSTTTGTVKTGFTTRTRTATNDEIKEAQSYYAGLLKEKLGYETLIKNLNGDALKNAVEKRELDAKSAKETEDKKLVYKKMSVATLKKLAEDEDELATEELKRRENSKHGAELLADAFKELSKQISDFDTGINNAIAAGNSPLVEKLTLEKKAAELLLKTYNEVKSAYASGWDMNQRDLSDLAMMVAKSSGLVTSDKSAGDKLVKRDINFAQGPTEEIQDAENDEKEKQLAIKEELLQGVQVLNDAIFSIVKNRQQAEFDQAMSLLEKQRAAELANKNLTEAQKAAINEKYNKKASALKLKQFKQDQNTAIAMTFMNGAIAAIKALATLGPVFGPIAAIGIGVKTIAEIAVIKSQKPPEYYEGGFTQSASSNRKPVGVVHANEYVIPAHMVTDPKFQPIINSLEVARQNIGLPTLNPDIYKSINDSFQHRKFEGGGFTSKEIGLDLNEALQNDLKLVLLKLDRTVTSLDQRIAKPLEATVAIRGRNGLYEKLEEDKQSQNNASL